MNKQILTLFYIGFLPLLANCQTFFLNKNLVVGCYNANPLTDLTKKVEIKQTSENEAILTIASLVCSFNINTELLGTVTGQTNAKAYYSEQDGKGFFIENNSLLSIFSTKDNKKEIIMVGCLDKKATKELSLEKEKAKYQTYLQDLEKHLNEAKERKKANEVLANTLSVPAGNYSDPHKISGVYYFSQQVYCKEHRKYVNAVNIEFTPDNELINIHYYEGKKPAEAFLGNYEKILLSKYGYITIHTSNENGIEALRSTQMFPLEEGLFLITHNGFAELGTSELDCSKPYFQNADKAILLGKNKARIDALLKNPSELEKLAHKSAVNYCEYLNAIQAEKTPLPAESFKDNKVCAEALESIKKHAAIAKWSQNCEYCYIKSKDWNYLTLKSTGAPVARTIRVVLVMSTEAGKCQWEEIEVKQDYTGSGYGKTYYNGNTQRIIPVDCKEAMRFK